MCVYGEKGQEGVEEEVDQPHHQPVDLPAEEDEADAGYALEDELGQDVEYEGKEDLAAAHEFEYQNADTGEQEFPLGDDEEDYEIVEDGGNAEDDEGVAQEQYVNEEYHYSHDSSTKRHAGDRMHAYNSRMGDEGFIEENYDADYSVNQMFKRKQKRWALKGIFLFCQPSKVS